MTSSTTTDRRAYTVTFTQGGITVVHPIVARSKIDAIREATDVQVEDFEQFDDTAPLTVTVTQP